jgi:hypothetical protein
MATSTTARVQEKSRRIGLHCWNVSRCGENSGAGCGRCKKKTRFAVGHTTKPGEKAFEGNQTTFHCYCITIGNEHQGGITK